MRSKSNMRNVFTPVAGLIHIITIESADVASETAIVLPYVDLQPEEARS